MTGKVGSLVLAGVWVGLAFQAKMLQAWLVVPALFGVYLIAAPATALLRRLGHVALALVVMVLVSLSFMTAVTAVPAHDRPYVDGSCDNSIFSQVFVYNGLDRFAATRVHQQGCSTPSHFLVETGKVGAALGLGTASIPPGLGRLLHGPFGRDDAWVVIPSVVAAAASVDLPATATPHRCPPGRRPLVVGLVGPHLGLLQRGAVPQLVLPRRTGSRPGRAVRPRGRHGVALPARRAHATGRAPDGGRQHRVRPHARARRGRGPALDHRLGGPRRRARRRDPRRLPPASPRLVVDDHLRAGPGRGRPGVDLRLGQRVSGRRRRGPVRHALPVAEDHLPQPGSSRLTTAPTNGRCWSASPMPPHHRWRPTSSSRPTSPARTSSPPGMSSYPSAVSPARSPHRRCHSSSTTSPREGSSPPPRRWRHVPTIPSSSG